MREKESIWSHSSGDITCRCKMLERCKFVYNSAGVDFNLFGSGWRLNVRSVPVTPSQCRALVQRLKSPDCLWVIGFLYVMSPNGSLHVYYCKSQDDLFEMYIFSLAIDFPLKMILVSVECCRRKQKNSSYQLLVVSM